MKNKETKTFDSVAFFRDIKEKLAKKNGRDDINSKEEFMRQLEKTKSSLLQWQTIKEYCTSV